MNAMIGSLDRLVERIDEHLASTSRHILVVGVDGSSASGKTSVARYLRSAHPEVTAVVHTDDLAWHHSFFGWHELLRTEILVPVAKGALPVEYRPPGWVRQQRCGAIRIGDSTRCLIVEGVGAAHRSVAEWLDVNVWVQASADVRAYRQEQRLRAGIDSLDFMDDWNAHERLFHQRDLPWTRADFMIDGNDARLREPATGPDRMDAGGRERLVHSS
ncbi:hypothetical protein GORHZ_045_00130 [Gordonia rhizosphera NBRC 16068]|uniref:Phosphoribulokinase/uridine kinase domain-containing protein n=2 Tax=Gordonia rhizosphera TaxID=83341 RepID=K6W9H0_9ACTN|nr:hypothetical protein GORHZ_045_00130 [Gordonia rhizosphera NBRC 16068]